MAEFDLIARIAARASTRADVDIGIGDDGALLSMPHGQRLVAVCDTVNCGVHFPENTAPEAIGWKALAVNLSDLAAMGATPAWVLLSLSLPNEDAAFADALMDGFLQLADQSGVSLVGGDTTRGPLSLTVTALGFVPTNAVLRRDAAKVGDVVCVSGSLGDAAAGLRLALSLPSQTSTEHAFLIERLNRPTPRLALGHALRSLAHAAIDISDGLLADATHLANASGVAIELNADALPSSPALMQVCDASERLRFQATGGDDYELVFTLPSEALAQLCSWSEVIGTRITPIGRVVEGSGVRLLNSEGAEIVFDRQGWVHFSESAE